jgi:hypothetical protein
MAVIIVFGLWWLPAPDLPVPDLNKEINAHYAVILTPRADSRFARIASNLPLPWEQVTFGFFNESSISSPTQAFGAGLWVGKRELSGSANRPLPTRLAPPTEFNWVDTEWVDYYQFGRWVVLLWAEAKAEQGTQDWARQERIFEALLVNFRNRPPTEVKANQAVAALRRIEPLLQAIRQQADHRTYAALTRASMIAIQQLAPAHL